jgi:anti-sigma B factor antagonist
MSDGHDENPGDVPPLQIATGQHGASLVVTVHGELDVATGPRLRTALGEALDRPDPGAVIVDLTGVTFLGSTGIAVLVDADWQAKQRNATLRVVVDRTPAVIRPLQATGVDNLLDTYPDLESALRGGGEAANGG